MEATENRLGRETSPYLRQHRFDPVDWYPWGEEAFARARDMDRPLFLSIGYSACHWCHVMGHESFADAETASEMNDLVVAVKVDREERPDVDSIYMEAVQAATGHGGWPMSVFATPDGRPFFAGTYFPNRPGHGAPTFRAVLAAVSDAWSTRRQDVVAQADLLRDTVARRLAPLPGDDNHGTSARDALVGATSKLAEIFDQERGGFGRAPKFPQPLLLDLLLVAEAEGLAGDLDPSPLTIVTETLQAMAAGGIWDHLGGGFARYSVDRDWLVPHFEKMLYDQALLARVYLHAWQMTGDERWRQVLDEIIAYVLRDLQVEGSGLASAEDADSEGAEGLFYTWTAAEIAAVLPPEEAEAALEWWGVEPAGNFEGRSILRRPRLGSLLRPPVIERARRALLETRSGRVRPGRDDKVLAEWNAMMCATLAEAALATGNELWKLAAEQLGALLLDRLRRQDGRVLRMPLSGERPEVLGYAADVAWMAETCVRLAQLTGHASWIARGTELCEQLLALFADKAGGGLFTTGHDAEELVVRPRDVYDGVIPAAGSVAAGALVRLASLAGRPDLAEAAGELLRSGAPLISAAPTAVPQLVLAAHLAEAGPIEVVVTGERPDLVSAAGSLFVPRAVLAWASPEAGIGSEASSPLLAGRDADLAYVCRHGTCRLPSSNPAEMATELLAAARQ